MTQLRIEKKLRTQGLKDSKRLKKTQKDSKELEHSKTRKLENSKTRKLKNSKNSRTQKSKNRISPRLFLVSHMSSEATIHQTLLS